MKQTSTSILAAAIFAAACAVVAAADNAAPQWVHDHWAKLTANGGVWIADNDAYQSDNEPFDQYGMEWSYGLGEQSVTGRLYGMIDGEETGTYWTFTSFWHPGEKKLIDLQFGTDGTIGMGESRMVGDTLYEQTMTFHSPDGSSFRSGHHIVIRDGEQHTKSYFINDDGEWVEDRAYVWRLVP